MQPIDMLCGEESTFNMAHSQGNVTGAGGSVGWSAGSPVSVHYLPGVTSVWEWFNIYDVCDSISDSLDRIFSFRQSNTDCD